MTRPVAVGTPGSPAEVVETFLARLAAADLDGSIALLAPRVEYVNVGLPTIRGARRIRRMFAWLQQRGVSFEVYIHAGAAAGGTVLNERTDVLSIGRLRQQFWVTGRFDVVNGQIVLWRDAFDFLDIVRSIGRGMLGAVVPALRPRPPGPDDAPGRRAT